MLARPASHARPSTHERGATGAHLLLAEDDDDIREGLARLLRFDGYHVRSARTGTELLEILATAFLSDHAGDLPFDILVTDVRMPGFDGLRILESLRADGWQQPVVIITSYSDAEMRQRIAKLDGVVLLEKPFDAEVLEAAVAHLANAGTGKGHREVDASAPV